MANIITIDGTNWQHVSVLSQIAEAINERCDVIGEPQLSSRWTNVAVGDIIQDAAFWNEACGKMRRLICGINGFFLSDGYFPSYEIQVGQPFNFFYYLYIFRFTIIPQVIETAYSMFSISNIRVSGDTELPIGFNYPELSVASGTIQAPNLDGYLILRNCKADDYLKINGYSLDNPNLTVSIDIDPWGGNPCGERTYISNIVCGRYSAGQQVSWELIDTWRGRYFLSMDIAFAPDFKYYKLDTTGMIHA